MPKSVRDIIDSILVEDKKISIVIDVNIPDTSGSQMAIQISSSPKVCFCII